MGNDSSFSEQFSAVSPPLLLHRTGQTDEKKKKLAGKVTANEANINHPSKKSPSKSEREENEREKSFKL